MVQISKPVCKFFILILTVILTSTCGSSASTTTPPPAGGTDSPTDVGDQTTITFTIDNGGALLEDEGVSVSIPTETVTNSDDGFIRPTEFEGCTDAGTILAGYDIILNSNDGGDVGINGNYTVGIKVDKSAYSAQDQLAACVWQLNAAGDTVANRIFFENDDITISDFSTTQVEVTIPLTVPNNAVFVVDRNGSSDIPPGHDSPGLLDPSSLSFNTFTQTSVRVFWTTAPDDSGGKYNYVVSLREGADPEEGCNGGTSTNVGPQAGLEHTFTSLSGGATYHARVCTVSGTERSTGRVATTPIVPLDSASLTASAITSSSFDMSWDAVVGNSTFLISIRQGADPDAGCEGGTSTNTEVGSTTLTESFSSLTASTTYHVRVCSENIAGVSDGIVQTATTSAGGGGGALVAMVYNSGTSLMLTSNESGNLEAGGSKQTVAAVAGEDVGTLAIDGSDYFHICAGGAGTANYWRDTTGSWSNVGSFGSLDTEKRPVISYAGANTYCYVESGSDLDETLYDGTFFASLTIDNGATEYFNMAAVYDGSRRILAYNTSSSLGVARTSDFWMAATPLSDDGNTNMCTQTRVLGAVVDSSNVTHVFYSCQYSGDGSIVKITYNGSWGAATEVLDLGPAWPIAYGDVAIDKNDRFYVLFDLSTAVGDYYFTTNDTGTWKSEVLAISGGVDTIDNPQIAVDDDRTVWFGYLREVTAANDEVTYKTKPFGSSFTGEVTVHSAAGTKFIDIQAK